MCICVLVDSIISTGVCRSIDIHLKIAYAEQKALILVLGKKKAG